jgi:hypothetical protein
MVYIWMEWKMNWKVENWLYIPCSSGEPSKINKKMLFSYVSQEEISRFIIKQALQTFQIIPIFIEYYALS